MRTAHYTIALLALASSSLAVSLSDFPPYLTSLPIGCDVVYKQLIIGCSPSDFGPGNACSSGCVMALQALMPLVDAACGNNNIMGQNIIVAFLAGVGPQSICKDANEILSSASVGSNSPSTSTATSIQGSSTSSNTIRATSVASGSSSATTTSTTGIVSSASTAPGPTSSTSSDTAAPSTSSLSASQTGSSTTSASPFSQTGMNDGSGGGSPFDTPGNLKSAASATSSSLIVSLFTTVTMLLLGTA